MSKLAERLSPAGRGAVAVWRLSDGSERWPGQLLAASGKRIRWPKHGELRHGFLSGPAGTIDEILALAGQGWLEWQTHGGLGVQQALATFLRQEGWSTAAQADAESGPTSLRAARSWASSRWGALAQLTGEARRVLAGEGPEEPAQRENLAARLNRALSLVGHGSRLRSPALVRLVGRPNAGKSSLFNALLADQRALVSPHPGTTRDTVRAELLLSGVPVVLEDTAGWEGDGFQEVCFSDPRPDLVVHLLRDPAETRLTGPGVLVVLGRADLRSPGPLLSVSGRTGHGLEGLCGALAAALGLESRESSDSWAPLEISDSGLLLEARSQLMAG